VSKQLPGSEDRKHKTLVIGLGSDVLGDDAFGLIVAQKLLDKGLDCLADIRLSCESGMKLLDHLLDYEKVIIVDSYLDPKGEAGKILTLPVEEDKTCAPCIHFFSIGQALALGRHLGLRVPSEVKAFAVVINEIKLSDEGLSPNVDKAVGAILGLVEEELRCTNSP
jgi:hydrogenase maturation protease